MIHPNAKKLFSRIDEENHEGGVFCSIQKLPASCVSKIGSQIRGRFQRN